MYKTSESTKPILCSKCLKEISLGESYYLNTKTSFCLECRSKDLLNRTNEPAYTTKFPSIGSKQWQAEVLKAVKHKSFKITLQPNICKPNADKETAKIFNVELIQSQTDKLLDTAKLFLIGLRNKGLI